MWLNASYYWRNRHKRFQAEGQVVLCGDFNARCGGLRDVVGGMVDRCNVDMVQNEQGERLVSV